MNNLKFRAYIKSIQKIVDVVEIDFKNKMATLDIATNEVCPEFSFWWKETELPFSNIEIMQSTGLFDKNGKEFFDGDIVASSGRYYVIQQSITGLWKAVKQERDETWYLTLCNVCDCFEIAGNIYENKELLG